MLVWEVTVKGTQYNADGGTDPVELIFFAVGETEDEAMVSITTGPRVSCLETVTDVRTIAL